ncbi:MAG: group III truncated hemoglobin [Flavobacteriales bacterium]|nr:group III truncated hemoglobin [Flavobacteriales bacterium]
MSAKRDLENEEDIKLLVNTFYEKVGKDELIGYLFNDVAKVHSESHLPKMVRFWSSVLLGAAEYKGNPMQKHVELSR